MAKRPGTLQTLLRKAKKEGWAKWVRSEADEHAVLNGCYFDKAKGLHVVEFYGEWLHHFKGEWAGQSFKLLDWERDDLTMPLFGWMRADGSRRYRTAYVEVPKKNGKSAWCSGLGLYMLVADGEQGAEVYSAAVDRDQAGIIFDVSASMVDVSPALSARCEVIRSRKRILFRPSWSTYAALSADVPTKEGLNIHCLLFDELHAQKTRALWETLRYGGAARRPPLLLSITTAGTDRKSICYEQRQYAERILDGSINDDAFFALIYAATKEEEEHWTDPRVWRRVNPSMGITIDEATFASDCREAQVEPAKENSFKRYRLNIWTEQITRWMPRETWMLEGNCRPVDAEALRGRPCWAGLDLASTTDLCALCLCFKDVWKETDAEGEEREVEEYRFLWDFWAPEEGWRKREGKLGGDFKVWPQKGLLTLTPGNKVDYAFIRKRINALAEIYSLKEIGFDPWNASQIATELGEQDGITMVEMRQGYKTLSEPMKKLMGQALDGRAVHGGHPVMAWMVSNVAARTDANENIAPDKEKSGDRIDGVTAAIMALGRASLQGGDEGRSIYEDRGVVTY